MLKAFAFRSSLCSTLCPSKASMGNISNGPGRTRVSPMQDGVSPVREPRLGYSQWDLAGRWEIWTNQAESSAGRCS